MRKPISTSVLLVDDDPTFCRIMAAAAAEDGIAIDWIDDPIQLQDMRHPLRYDGVLLDFNMGQVNGLDIADYLASLCGNVPIILVTAKRLQDFQHQHWPKTVSHFISKSNGLRRIVRYIKNAIQSEAQERLKLNTGVSEIVRAAHA